MVCWYSKPCRRHGSEYHYTIVQNYIREGFKKKQVSYSHLVDKGRYPGRNSASIWTLSKGGGGGPTRIQIIRGTFVCLDLDIFWGGGEGWPQSKTFKALFFQKLRYFKHFFLDLDIFLGGEGGLTPVQNFWGTFVLKFWHSKNFLFGTFWS